MENKFLESKLEGLLRSKTFEQLTAVEQSYVLQFLSEEEYADMAFILLNAKAGLLSNYDKLQPLPQTFNVLTKAVADKNLQKQSIIHQSRYPVLLAAVLLALIGSVFIFLHFNQSKSSLIRPVARLPKIENKAIQNQKIQIAETKITVHPTVKNISTKRNKRPLVKIKSSPIGYKPATYLCSDLHIICITSTIRDTLSNIPCLNTRVIMPQADDSSSPGYKTLNNKYGRRRKAAENLRKFRVLKRGYPLNSIPIYLKITTN